tara:strand:- start:518335 stop:518655 length:321 start_codon:yes stop_codon:yes gene_type:complete
MKSVISAVIAIAGFHVAIYYGSCYVMGGIEAGLPGGGNRVYGDYHEGNQVTAFFKGESIQWPWSSSEQDPNDPAWNPGQAASNPFVESVPPSSVSTGAKSRGDLSD